MAGERDVALGHRRRREWTRGETDGRRLGNSDLQEQTSRAGVAFFLKQLGGVRNKRGGDAAAIDGQCWRQMPDAAVSV